ncbi:MAG: metallophosphoesterase [archaeon]
MAKLGKAALRLIPLVLDNLVIRLNGRNASHRPYGTTKAQDQYIPPEVSKEKVALAEAIKEAETQTLGGRIYSATPNHPVGLDGLRILHLSDAHFGKRDDRLRLESYLAHLPGYDIAVFTGDCINRSGNDLEDYHYEFLRQIRPKSGRKFFVPGNHEYFDTSAMGTIERQGFEILTNKSAQLEHRGARYNIIGLDDATYGKIDVNAAMAGIGENDLNIMALHNLDGLTDEVPAILDFALSGHTHAGIFNLGIIRGIDYLRKRGEFENINLQISGFKFLTDRTLSYISPGIFSYLSHKTHGRIERIWVQKPGMTVLTL